MSFLNPGLLGFMAAIAVPILIHLLNRRRFRRVTWAAMRFVRASLEKNRRRMQVEDLILLVLRCLVVGLFAFALARPALRSGAAFLDSGRVTAVVMIDHSASMGASDGARRRFELAREAALEAVDAYPRGSAVAVLLAGDRVTAPLPEPTPDLNLVRKTLREAVPGDLATDHSVAVAAGLEILRSSTALRKELLLVTDRQAAGWRRLPDIESALREEGRDERLRVLFVGEPLDDNLAVASIGRAPGFAAVGEPLRFDAEIVNHGRAPVRQVRATLHVDGGPAVDEGILEVLAPGEARRVTLFGRLPGEGFHSVAVRLPADRLPADDERVMVVQAVKDVRVLVVDGDPGSNSAFFLRQALQPVPAEAAPDYFLQPMVISVGQLATTRLPDFVAVILADVPTLSASAVEALTRYVGEGGALLIFPGPQAKPDFYNGELAGRAGWMPALLGKVRVADGAGDDGPRLQSSGYQHPVFALWNEPGAGSLAAVRFRSAWELRPLPVATNGAAGGGDPAGSRPPEVMLRFSDGTPAAVERVVGRGRVMLFASTAGTAWNDLAVRPAFVPWLHRSVSSIAELREARWNLRVGGLASLREPGEYGGREVTIDGPGTPGGRWTRLLRSVPGASLLEFDETLRAGVYRVSLPGVSRPTTLFAVQPDTAESEVTELTAEQRGELERVAQVVDWQPGLDVRSVFERERVGVELWLPLVLGVLLLGVVEVGLAQRFSRAK